MCVCDNIISDTSIHLRLLDNGISIGGLAGAMVLTWYSTLFFVGNGAGPANDALQSPGTVTANAEVLASYDRLFVAGRQSWLDVMNAARELIQAQTALVDVAAQRIAARARLRLHTGEML